MVTQFFTSVIWICNYYLPKTKQTYKTETIIYFTTVFLIRLKIIDCPNVDYNLLSICPSLPHVNSQHNNIQQRPSSCCRVLFQYLDYILRCRSIRTSTSTTFCLNSNWLLIIDLDLLAFVRCSARGPAKPTLTWGWWWWCVSPVVCYMRSYRVGLSNAL